MGSWPGGDSSSIPISLCDEWSDAQAKEFRIQVNRSATWAEWDDESLSLELQDLKDAKFVLHLTGFEEGELARLLAAQETATGLTDEDALPEVAQLAASRPGDTWHLGPHTLLVGDATKSQDVARLINTDTADFVFTDPPYNCDYEGYTEERPTIQGDRMTGEQFPRFLADSSANYRRIVRPGASLYVCHSSARQREFQNALENAGLEVRCQIIWAKNTFT